MKAERVGLAKRKYLGFSPYRAFSYIDLKKGLNRAINIINNNNYFIYSLYNTLSTILIYSLVFLFIRLFINNILLI